MKNRRVFVFTLVCILALCGCNPSDPPQDAELSTAQNQYALPPSLLTCYTAQQPYYLNPDLEISQEQAEFMLTVWNDSSWDDGAKEAVYDYVFRGDRLEIRYCYDEGIFYDTVNSRHVVLSSGLKKQVNNIIDKFIVLPNVD